MILAALKAQAQVVQVPYAPLVEELGRVIDFESFPKYMSPGTRLDDVQDLDGASFAERFLGQEVLQDQGFDALSGAPLAPLTLVPGAPKENLSVTFYFLISNHLVGNAAPGFPESRAGGEGAIAALFDINQRALGFRVAAEPTPETEPAPPKGRMTVRFYRRDGSLIDELDLALEWGRAGYGFAMADDSRDIAGITITNRDPAGIAIDDIVFDAIAVTGVAPGWRIGHQSRG